MTQEHDEAPATGVAPTSERDVGASAVPGPRRPSIHDEPTLVEDAPQPPSQPAETETGRAFPGGLQRLADRYRLEDPIASGGAAVVWRAFDEVLSRTVAIKLLHPHLAGDARTVERFRLESINAARLSHPNVVSIYDTGQEGDVVYLVMEHVDGPSLREILTERGGGLDPELVAALGEQVASALGEAHEQGLVHRDVKPANILLTSDGVAKVTDFGIAKALAAGGSDELTQPGTLVGTAAYIAPEQLSEAETVDGRADVYALGIVLHECLTGHRAFQGDTPAATAAARLDRELLPPRQVRADVPRLLDDVIVRATRIDPGERYADGAALAHALQPPVRQRPSDTTAQLLAQRAERAEVPRPEVSYLDEATGPHRLRRVRRVQRGRLLTGFAAGLAVALALMVLLDDDTANDDTALSAPVEVGAGVQVFGASDFDPYGGDRENPELVGNLLDGDPSTGWSTQQYAAPLRSLGTPGVGVWLDLGESVPVDQVVVDLTTSDVTFEVLVRDTPPAPGDVEADWQPVERVEADATTTVVDTGGRQGRWWLLWFTDLARVGETWSAEVSGVRFVGSS